MPIPGIRFDDEAAPAATAAAAPSPTAAPAAELPREEKRRQIQARLSAMTPTERRQEKRKALLAMLALAAFIAFQVWGALTPPPPAPSAAGSHPAIPPLLVTVAKYAWAGLLAAFLGHELWKRKAQQYWWAFRALRPLDFVQNALVLLVIGAIGLGLRLAAPWLNHSWLYLLPGSDGSAPNIGVAPMLLPVVGLPFLCLFVLLIPMFAHDEERRYRRGTRSWRHGVVRSLRFGLAHSIWAGIPLYGGLALSIGGLWFTYQYFRGGVERSTRHHVAYNLLVVAAIAGYVVVRFFVPDR